MGIQARIVGAAPLALIALVSAALRLPFLSVPLITDEAGYAYVAHWLARGLALYRDLWFDRPQGIFLVYGAQMALLGETTEQLRLGAAMYNALTCLAVYTLGSALASRRAALGAAALYAICSSVPQIEGFTGNGELYMNFPLVGCLALAARGRWFWAGAALALAFTVKPTALPAAGPPLAVLALWGVGTDLTPFLSLKRRGEAPKPQLVVTRGQSRSTAGLIVEVGRRALLGLTGAVVALAPFVAHGVATDPVLYWYSVAGFRVQAHSAFSVGPALLGDFGLSAPSVLVALAPLWLLAGLGVAGGGWRTRAGATGLAFFAGSFLGAAAGGYWYWHYYVGLVPAAALLGGLGLERLRVSRTAPAVWLLGGATLVAVAFNARLVGATPEETSWRLYQRPAYLASGTIARYLRERTSEGDTVYAAFAQADLYHLSGRLSAGKHLYWTEINRVPGAFEAVLEALDDPRRRPAYVIGVDKELEVPGRAVPFWERVARYYVPETEIGGFTLYRRVVSQ